jgi:hypothetical protein
MAASEAHASGSDHPKEIVIHIDKQQFKVEVTQMTGAQLRALPPHPIGPDRDLYEEVPAGEDILIGDDQSVELKSGMHFFTTPHSITPGG